jgi:hypothetical protein
VTQGGPWIRFWRWAGVSREEAKRASGVAGVTKNTLCALCPRAVMARMANVRFTAEADMDLQGCDVSFVAKTDTNEPEARYSMRLPYRPEGL